MKKVGDKPALVSLYSRTAAKAFEPVGQESGQVYYETSLAQVRKKNGNMRHPGRYLACPVVLQY